MNVLVVNFELCQQRCRPPSWWKWVIWCLRMDDIAEGEGGRFCARGEGVWVKKLTPLDQIVLLSRGQPRASHCGWAVAGGRRKNLQTVIHSKTDWVTRTTWVTWANRETWVSSVTRLTNDQDDQGDWGNQGLHADRGDQCGRDFWIVIP